MEFHKAIVTLAVCALALRGADSGSKEAAPKTIGFHPVRVDAEGHLLPWAATDPGTAYDKTLNLVWFYWAHVPPYWDVQPDRVVDGVKIPSRRLGALDLPKYMLFRTLETQGIGGDQFAMLLSSWALYYQYSGDEAVKANMIYLADTYLAHGLSAASAAWPNLPYPCNIGPELVYDGDLILGKGVTQPDKAGSFGAELVTLYEMTGNEKYLQAAVNIADVLAAKTTTGDENHSPLPFKVNANTGEVREPYTTNWTGALRLFQSLQQLQKGNTARYQEAFGMILAWMKKYPLVSNHWGPFFEDIIGNSETEINAGTFAWYLMENKSWDANWKIDVRNIQDWVLGQLGNHSFEKSLGVLTMNEQTAYAIPGQSHSSRHASIELRYAAETGDARNQEMAIRQLNWATYFVDDDGKNKYPDPNTFEIWWTDGYGDYVRHYLRAMAADPELAPRQQTHLLHSTSAVQTVKYSPTEVGFTLYDAQATTTLRARSKPVSVVVDGRKLKETARDEDADGWSWRRLTDGGVVRIQQSGGRTDVVRFGGR